MEVSPLATPRGTPIEAWAVASLAEDGMPLTITITKIGLCKGKEDPYKWGLRYSCGTLGCAEGCALSLFVL